jgi:Cu+-exporting ATPase
MVRDPVCGRVIELKDTAGSRAHVGQRFYFCSANCVEKFDADPHRYAPAALTAAQDALPAGSATTGFNPDLPLARIELPVLGLKLERDGQAVEAALARVPGVRSAHANTGSGVVTVEYDPQRATTAALAEALRPAGFRAGGAQTHIGIEGLRCASCVGFIEEDLRATPGVLSASVNAGTQEATIAYLPQQTMLAQLQGVIQDWGYHTRPAASEECACASPARRAPPAPRQCSFPTSTAAPRCRKARKSAWNSRRTSRASMASSARWGCCAGN